MVRLNSKKAKIISSKTRKNKGNRSSVNQKSFDNMLKCMLETLISIKLYHWNTYSYSTHKATDDIYGSLSDNIDNSNVNSEILHYFPLYLTAMTVILSFYYYI